MSDNSVFYEKSSDVPFTDHDRLVAKLAAASAKSTGQLLDIVRDARRYRKDPIVIDVKQGPALYAQDELVKLAQCTLGPGCRRDPKTKAVQIPQVYTDTLRASIERFATFNQATREYLMGNDHFMSKHYRQPEKKKNMAQEGTWDALFKQLEALLTSDARDRFMELLSEPSLALSIKTGSAAAQGQEPKEYIDRHAPLREPSEEGRRLQELMDDALSSLRELRTPFFRAKQVAMERFKDAALPLSEALQQQAEAFEKLDRHIDKVSGYSAGAAASERKEIAGVREWLRDTVAALDLKTLQAEIDGVRAAQAKGHSPG